MFRMQSFTLTYHFAKSQAHRSWSLLVGQANELRAWKHADISLGILGLNTWYGIVDIIYIDGYLLLWPSASVRYLQHYNFHSLRAICADHQWHRAPKCFCPFRAQLLFLAQDVCEEHPESLPDLYRNSSLDSCSWWTWVLIYAPCFANIHQKIWWTTVLWWMTFTARYLNPFLHLSS